MAREQRKPKKSKKKDEPQIKEEADLIENGKEREVPGDEDGLKPFDFFFDVVPNPQMTEEAKEEIAVLIRRLRAGEKLPFPQSRPMPDIGARCHELRIREADGLWRIFYRSDPDIIVSVHVLWKTTSKTPKSSIDLCKKRFAQYDAARVAWEAEQKREAERKAKKRF